MQIARYGASLIALLLLAACGPQCGGQTALAGSQHLVFTGPAAGTMTDATTMCAHYPKLQQINYHFDGALGNQPLSLNIQVHSAYTGPGTYPVGSLLDGAGEVRLQVGTLQVSSATGAGTVMVDKDERSGSLTVSLGSGEHVAGTFRCDKVQTN